MQSTLGSTRPLVLRYPNRIERSPADFAILFTGLLLLVLMVGILWWQFWHVNRIYSGVTVGGVPVGGLTRAKAVTELNHTFTRYPLPPVALTFDGRQWPITSEHLRARIDLMAAVNEAYMIGRRGDFRTRLRTQVGTALFGVDIAPDLEVDQAQLRYEIAQIANDVRRPARAAASISSVQIPAEVGIDVDIESTVHLLVASLEGEPVQSLVAPLQVVWMDPPPPLEQIDQATVAPLPRPLVVRSAEFGLEFGLDPATIHSIILAQEPVRLDEDLLSRLLEQWAAQIAISPRDARLQFDPQTGDVQALRGSRAGRRLDVEATKKSVVDALITGQSSALLVVKSVAPAVDSGRIQEMGIRELVASGTTYFQGSSAARIRNIEVAAEKFNGVAIPPGEIFSFNLLVEDITAANGFEDSLVIWGDRTAVGVGGGVCQVSTTIFRAAYAAGLPIVERYNHGYVVDWYGEPGLDATIYTPTVDFRFRNDTDAYLLVEPIVNGGQGTITFNLYGTKPDRQVTIGAPVIENVEQPEPPVYTVDSSLAAGQRSQVEWEKPGMTVKVQRTIVENGTTRTDTLTSKYQPWRAIYLVGPGTDVPAAAPTSDLSPDAVGAGTDGVTQTETADSQLPAALATPTP